MKIAPSMLSCDFGHMGRDLKNIELAGADYIHLDVMDGVFVPNLTFGAPIIKALRVLTHLPFDVHLMIQTPEKYIKDFASAGADIITFHIETQKNPQDIIKKIRSYGKKVGVSLKPNTSIDSIANILDLVDLVLIMTVEPGFGGQKFMPDMMQKVEDLKKIRKEKNLNFLIEVDGGINEETAQIAKKHKVDIAVAGTSVFSSSDWKKAIENLRNSLKIY